jgi:aminomethyltransferase
MLLESEMSDPEKRLPLDAWHQARGARMVPFAGYSMPVQYDGIIAEHLWTRSSAGLFDVSHMGQFHVSGRDLERSLESVMPADLVTLQDGRLRYSMLTTEIGGIIDDLIATRRGEHFYLVVNGATCSRDLEHLRSRLPDLVIDHMREQALLALQGPRAAEVLEKLAPGVSALNFMSGAGFRIGATSAWISRSGYTGEDGFEISVPAVHAEAIADQLTADEAVRPVGLGARDSLRLEAGLPLYGHDLDYDTSPIEAGLGFAIAKRRREQGNFPGGARVLRELAQGPDRCRVGLRVAGRQPVREGADVIDHQGEPIGRVTSGGHSPSLEAPIAMAYVPTAWAIGGNEIRLSQRGRTFDAWVVDMPFLPHRYHRKEPRK